MRTRLALMIGIFFASGYASAGTNFSNFTPLTSSVAAGSLPESSPFTLANPSWTQTSIADRGTQLAAAQFNSGSWDMNTVNENGASAGRYLFTVFETAQSGIQRHDLQTRTTTTIWQSPAPLRHVAFDASYWTPWGTFITAEENWSTASGGANTNPYGRLFEVTNPLSDPAAVNNVHRNAVPRVSHEGIQFDSQGRMYFIDELNGGSIYRYTSQTPNAATFFNAGTSAVLRVGSGTTPNATGTATWVDFTDANGAGLSGALTITDPNGVTSVDGRNTTELAAFKGTDYQRPEDLQIKTLPNGNQLLYFATTSTQQVYTLNLATNSVSVFADRNTIDEATGLAVGNAFTSPDNLAIDSDGNIYIIEDQPGGTADIWFTRDADNNGVADSMARWASLSTNGAEPTGLYFDPFNPNRAWVNVQHPDSLIDRTIEINAVPLPAALPLLLAGMGGLGLLGWRRKASVCAG